MASADVHALLDSFSRPRGLVSQLQPAASQSATSLRPSSRDARSSSEPIQWPLDRSESLARSLLSKSSLLLKRKTSKVSLMSFHAIEWDDGQNDRAGSKDVQELSKRRRSKHGRNTSDNYESMLKKSISDPYDFQHLTHTSEQHAKVLQTATQKSQDELVSEFSAMRASQAARKELKGIKAESITGNKSLSRQNSVLQRVSTPAIQGRAPTTPPSESELDISPKTHYATRASPSQKGLRTSQSVDNFSRINPRSFSSPSPPRSPPPRRSSRSALNLPLDAIGKTQSPPKAKPITSSDNGIVPHNDALYQITVEACMSMLAQHNPSSVGNAVSTPDNSAYTLRPQLSSSSIALADVPEEEEPSVSTCDTRSMQGLGLSMASSHKHRRASTMFDLTSNAALKLKEERKLIAHASHHAVHDNAGAPTAVPEARDTHVRSTMSQADASLTTSFSDSWEDDIDYCYEHAAEADCAFDWDRVSCDDEREASALDRIIDEIIDSAASSFHHVENELGYATSPVTGSHLDLLSTVDPQPYVYTYLDPSHIKAPGQSRSPLSSTSSTAFASEALTPSEATSSPNLGRYSRRHERESGIFPISPSLLTSYDYEPRIIEDSSCPSKDLPERFETLNPSTDLPLYEPRFPASNFSGEDSLFSNANPLSKSNSRDSLPNSMRASSHESLHGTTSSIGSLPELVHSSRTSGRELPAGEALSGTLAKVRISMNATEIPSSAATLLPEDMSVKAAAPTSSQSVTPEVQPMKRERSLSECPERKPSPSVPELDRPVPGSSSGFATPNPTSKSFVGRMRSASVATTASGMAKKSRASYSLFPSVPVPGPR